MEFSVVTVMWLSSSCDRFAQEDKLVKFQYLNGVKVIVGDNQQLNKLLKLNKYEKSSEL